MKSIMTFAVALIASLAFAGEINTKDAKPAHTDPVLYQLEQSARRQRNRAVVIDKTARQYKPEARTELIVREARQSFQERLTEARNKFREEVQLRLKLEDNLADIKSQLSAKVEELRDKSARLDRIRTYLEGKRDEARLSTTMAIYQAILDKLDEVGE